MTTPPRDDEPARDPWLSHALRHAPDANAAPSPELSDAILRSARNAVKRPAAASPSRASPWMAWWSWLARPPVAAGFATVMVAVLVGVMWIDKPLDEALPSKSDVPAAAPAREVTPPPARAPAPAEAPAVVDAMQDAAKKDAARANAREAETRATAAVAAPPRPAPAAKRERAEPKPSAPAAQADAPPAAPSPFTDNATQPAAPSAAPSPVAAPAPRRDDAVAERRSAESAAGALAKSAAPSSTAMALRSQGDGGAAPPFVIDAPARWRWQRGGEPQAMAPALQRWIDLLHQSARWRAASGSAPGDADLDTLTLWRDGAPYATIQIGQDTAWLTLRDRAPLAAPLAPATAAALKSSLRDATR